MLIKQIADLKNEIEDLQDLNKKLQSDLDKTSEDIIKLEGEIEDLKDKNKILNGKLYQDASPEKEAVIFELFRSFIVVTFDDLRKEIRF